MNKFIIFLLIFTCPVAMAQNDRNCQLAKTNVNNVNHPPQTVNPLINDYDVKFYGLDLSATNTSTYLEGNVAIQAVVTSESLSEFVIELIEVMIVDSVEVNSNTHNYTRLNHEISVPLASPLTRGDLFEVKVYYHGDPSSSSNFSSIYNATSESWGNQVTYTLSEPFGAKVWWPCKQVLEDKADSAHIFITVPDHLMAGSNGLLTHVEELPGKLKRYEWKTKYPIAYYLISMTIGSYVIYETYAEPDGSEPILIQNFIYDNPDCLPNFKDDLDEIDDLIELYSELYGLYPFHKEKYGHCMAPFSGGMEHQTMTTQGYFNLTLDAHELGHQWFGDNVTCRYWQDIWVNEGFARYSEYLALENLRSKNDADKWINKEYLDILELPGGSVYVPQEHAEDDSRIFEFRLTYQKGGALVHMIRNIINDDAVFFDALTDFQRIFKDSTATGMDLKAVLEETSGHSLETFFDEWYVGEGYPIYDITWNYYSDTLYIDQKQSTSTSTIPLFHTPLEYKISFDSKDSLFRVAQSSNEQQFKFYVPEEVQSLQADPNEWLLKKISSFKKDSNPDAVTGVPTDKEKLFRVFPNPSKKWLMIENIYRFPVQVVLTDLQGRVVLEQQFHNQSPLRLNLNHFELGVYILRLTGDNRSQHFKIRKD